MKFAATAVALALCSTSALAKYITSDPFKLILINDSKKYNGTALSACHEGAAIEGLCPEADSSKAQTYKFKYYNYSTSGSSPSKKYGPLGVIIYDLHAGNITEPEQMQLYTDPSTNVALALFYPEDSENVVAFDSKNNLNMQSYYNDLVTPPTDSTFKAYYRWYVCQVDYSGYTYETLNWVYGKYAPENPSCVATTVNRVFTSS